MGTFAASATLFLNSNFLCSYGAFYEGFTLYTNVLNL